MQKGLNLLSHPASDSGYRSSTVPDVKHARSVFNRSHSHKMTMNAGYLVPFLVDEVLPGDTHSLTPTFAGRLIAPLEKPIMDNLYIEWFAFFVPMRLVWDNAEKFFGERDNPDDSIDYMIPTVQIPQGGVLPNTLHDYFGLPLNPDNPITVNALPYRAHNLIYKDWFRDQNVIDSPTISTNDGPDIANNYSLFKRRKRRDYFTACLPQPQKGDAVEISISGGVVPVQGIGISEGQAGPGAANVDVVQADGVATVYPEAYGYNTFGGVQHTRVVVGDNNQRQPDIHVDLDRITSITINQLRQSVQVQRLLERDARGGTRYIEILRSHFGVVSPDARLQRPEYLGGGKAKLDISGVATTAGTTAPEVGRRVGDLAAFMSVGARSGGFSQSFVEHGYIICYANVFADLTYQQGLHKMWKRQDRLDFMWPALVGIGEQAVNQGELFWSGVEAEDSLVFGYIPRYEEYRTKPSQISGTIRSTADNSLDVWHMAQEFANAPTLSQQFVEENPPMGRVKAIDDVNVPDFVFDIWNQYTSARALPTYGVPGHIDSF
jgi:hypothetical protein